MSISVLEYLGKIADGLLVLLSVIYEGEYYEATVFYNNTTFIITADEELEAKLQTKIENLTDYQKIKEDLKLKLVPFDQIVNRIDKLDVSRWTKTI